MVISFLVLYFHSWINADHKRIIAENWKVDTKGLDLQRLLSALHWLRIVPSRNLATRLTTRPVQPGKIPARVLNPPPPVNLRRSSGCLSRMVCTNSRKKANIAKGVPKRIFVVDELQKIFLLLFYLF
jgi:hypothetical protein